MTNEQVQSVTMRQQLCKLKKLTTSFQTIIFQKLTFSFPSRYSSRTVRAGRPRLQSSKNHIKFVVLVPVLLVVLQDGGDAGILSCRALLQISY